MWNDRTRPRLLSCGVIAGILSLAPVGRAAPTLPNPCTLITVPELEQIVGEIKGSPKPSSDSPGEVACEYTLAKDSSWIQVGLFPGDESDFERNRKSFGGKGYAAAPDLGKDAFVNSAYMDFSAELFVKKGSVVLRVSMPTKAPSAVDKIKAIARVALPRM
jgi:hypothetical protein